MIKIEKKNLSNKLICCLGASCFALLVASVSTAFSKSSFNLSKRISVGCSQQKFCSDTNDLSVDLDLLNIENSSVEIPLYLSYVPSFELENISNSYFTTQFIRGPPLSRI